MVALQLMGHLTVLVCSLTHTLVRCGVCVCDHTHPVQFIDEGQCSNEILTESIQSLCLVEDSLSDNRLLS